MNLSFRMPGLLVTLPVKVGDVVKEGQLLAQIDPRHFEVNVQRAEADLEKAKTNLQAMEAGAREEDIAAKKAEIRSLEAALADAKNRLDDTVLVAPFAGRIAAVDVVNHQMVQANRSIVRLLNASRIEMTVNVPESAIALLQYLRSRLSEEQLESCRKIECTFKPSQNQEIRVPAKIKEIGTLQVHPTLSSETTTDLPIPGFETEPSASAASFVEVFRYFLF